MAGVKFMVIYPRPTDIEAFEKVYQDEHVPKAVEKRLSCGDEGAGISSGDPTFYRIAEIHFPSIEALEACAGSAGAKETLAHAVSISTGGSPIFLIAEERTFTF